MPFKVTPFNDSVLYIYDPSGHSTREKLLRGCFFKRLKCYIKNKFERNEKKIILGDFNNTMDKMDKYGGNKTQRFYRCCSNYSLSKLIVNNGL